MEPVAPEAWLAGGEGGVGDLDRHGPGGLGGQVAAPHVADVILGVAVLAGGDRPDPGVGAVGVDGQQQPLGQHAGVQVPAAGGGGDRSQAAGAQHGLLEHVDQRHGAPPGGDVLLQQPQVARLGSGVQRGELDVALAALGDL